MNFLCVSTSRRLCVIYLSNSGHRRLGHRLHNYSCWSRGPSDAAGGGGTSTADFNRFVSSAAITADGGRAA